MNTTSVQTAAQNMQGNARTGEGLGERHAVIPLSDQSLNEFRKAEYRAQAEQQGIFDYEVDYDEPLEKEMTLDYDEPVDRRDDKVAWSTFATMGSVQMFAKQSPAQAFSAPQYEPTLTPPRMEQHPFDERFQQPPVPHEQYAAFYQPPVSYQPTLTPPRMEQHPFDKRFQKPPVPHGQYAAFYQPPICPQPPISYQPTLTPPRMVQHPFDKCFQQPPTPYEQYAAFHQPPICPQPQVSYQPTSVPLPFNQLPSLQQSQPFQITEDMSLRPPMHTSLTWTQHPMPPAYGQYTQTPSYPVPGPYFQFGRQPRPRLQPPLQPLQQQQPWQPQQYQQPQHVFNFMPQAQAIPHDPAKHTFPSNAARPRVQLHQAFSSKPNDLVFAWKDPHMVSSVIEASELPARRETHTLASNPPDRPQLHALAPKPRLTEEQPKAVQSAAQTQMEPPVTILQAARTQVSRSWAQLIARAFPAEKLLDPQHNQPRTLPNPQHYQPLVQAVNIGTPESHNAFPDPPLSYTQQNGSLQEPVSPPVFDSNPLCTDAERDRDTLGVNNSASQDEIRAAYWDREFECHPARHRDATPEFQTMMAEKLAKAQGAVDRLKGFEGLSWGVWEGLEEYSNP